MPLARFRPSLSAAILAGAALAMPATAEPVGQGASPATSDIVVEAPRALPKPRRANRFAGEPEVFATVRVPVMYYDLDIADPKGAERLYDRIRISARQACSYLDALYPLRPDPECAKRAVDKATPAARAAIDAARAKQQAATPAPAPAPAP